MLKQHGEYRGEDPDTGQVAPAPGGPHLHLTALDAIFYLWAFALFLEEMHQWAVDASRDMTHVGDLDNIIDLISLSALLLAFAVRVLAIATCDDGAFTADAWQRGLYVPPSAPPAAASGAEGGT